MPSLFLVLKGLRVGILGSNTEDLFTSIFDAQEAASKLPDSIESLGIRYRGRSDVGRQSANRASLASTSTSPPALPHRALPETRGRAPSRNYPQPTPLFTHEAPQLGGRKLDQWIENDG
jgi:hypothetical protein